MTERKGGNGSFRGVVGEVLRAPIEIALEQRRSGSRLANTALIASLLGIEMFPLINLIQREAVSLSDFLPIVGLDAVLYVGTGLIFYMSKHHSSGPFTG